MIRILNGYALPVILDGFGIFPNLWKSVTILKRRIDSSPMEGKNGGTTRRYEFNKSGHRYIVTAHWNGGELVWIGLHDPSDLIHGEDELARATFIHVERSNRYVVHYSDNFPSLLGGLNIYHTMLMLRRWRDVATASSTTEIKTVGRGAC